MKITIMTLSIALLASSSSFAQAPAVTHDPPRNAAPGTTAPMTKPLPPVSGKLVPGANSFTEAQARTRITDAGYSNVRSLALDSNGIWRATATRAGQNVNVGVDYKGNVAEQ